MGIIYNIRESVQLNCGKTKKNARRHTGTSIAKKPIDSTKKSWECGGYQQATQEEK